MTGKSKRERLIDSAVELFHRRGTHAASLADIAAHADIPLGNVYYYFKTKEELALAVVAKHREQFRAAYALLDENFEDPRQRLIEALTYFDKVRGEYAKYGCPVGRMIENRVSKNDNIAAAAAQVFADFVNWGENQFRQLGHSIDDGRRYAMSLMAGIQGATVMARAFDDPQPISDEIARLTAWLEQLPNKKVQLGKVRANLILA